jgi:hypothetical protein
MRRLICILGSIAVLSGCGGMPADARPVGFVNHTIHSDAQLRTIWKVAQESISQHIDLNPLQRQAYPDTQPNLRPGDSRALTVQPHQVVVAGENDVTADDLYSATGVDRPNPTGLILCPQPCNVKYAAAYSKFDRSTTKYASSWDNQGQNFELILQYEFENQILFALGYDLKWR